MVLAAGCQLKDMAADGCGIFANEFQVGASSQASIEMDGRQASSIGYGIVVTPTNEYPSTLMDYIAIIYLHQDDDTRQHPAN